VRIEPIIPVVRREPFDDPGRLFELKRDGFRGIADTVNGRMLSKNKIIFANSTGYCGCSRAAAGSTGADSQSLSMAEPGITPCVKSPQARKRGE
jgi:hypothetical protein